jgi:hypothetical protein
MTHPARSLSSAGESSSKAIDDINRSCGKRVYRIVNVTILTFSTVSLVATVIKMWCEGQSDERILPTLHLTHMMVKANKDICNH